LARGHAGGSADGLRVNEVDFGEVEASELRVKANLPLLGPKLGRDLAAVRKALEEGAFEKLPGGGFRAAGHDLSADEVLVERRGKGGFAVGSAAGVTVGAGPRLDAEPG